MRTARVVLVATAVGATAGAAVVFSLVESPASDIGKSTVASTSVASLAPVTIVRTATPPVIIAAPVADNPARLTSPVAAATVAAVPATALPTPAQEPAPVQAKLDEPKTDQPATDAPPAVPSAQPMIASDSRASAVADGQVAAPAVSDATAASTPDAPASVAALAEAPPAPAVALAQIQDEAVAPDAPPPQKKLVRRHVAPTHYAQRSEPGYHGVNVRGRPPADDVGLAPLLRRLFSARSGYSSN